MDVINKRKTQNKTVLSAVTREISVQQALERRTSVPDPRHTRGLLLNHGTNLDIWRCRHPVRLWLLRSRLNAGKACHSQRHGISISVGKRVQRELNYFFAVLSGSSRMPSFSSLLRASSRAHVCILTKRTSCQYDTRIYEAHSISSTRCHGYRNYKDREPQMTRLQTSLSRTIGS